MKTLFLLRHSKTEPQSLIKSDFNRKLIERGHLDIKKVAQKFNELNMMPDLILCSTAVRARETLTGFVEETGKQYQIEFLDGLYHASASEILDIIHSYQHAHDAIMVVGHNFGISNLANWLSLNGAEELPTSGMHILEFETSLEPTTGKLIHFLKPKAI
ncbi:MAG: histidine phosphatase family protein [Bacteroidia bacterium]|nr:histidine phosphatase family protein [Bacteroidia bacterium]